MADKPKPKCEGDCKDHDKRKIREVVCHGDKK